MVLLHADILSLVLKETNILLPEIVAIQMNEITKKHNTDADKQWLPELEAFLGPHRLLKFGILEE
jgi:hypothetical protein